MEFPAANGGGIPGEHPVDMLATKDPIGDILARVKYLSDNGGIRERHLCEIIIQNGYATNKTWGSYHKPIMREGRTFDLYIDVVVNTVNDEYYYFVREGHSQSTEMSYITMGEVIQPHSHMMTWAGLHRGPRGEIRYVYVTDITDAAFGKPDSIYMVRGNLSESYTYDATCGRLIEVVRRTPDKSFSNQFTYDWN